MKFNRQIIYDLLKDEDVRFSRRTDMIITYPGTSLRYGGLCMLIEKYGLTYVHGNGCVIITGWR